MTPTLLSTQKRNVLVLLVFAAALFLFVSMVVYHGLKQPQKTEAPAREELVCHKGAVSLTPMEDGSTTVRCSNSGVDG